MCTYNGAKFLQEQLDSLVSQTRQPDEVVICDDRSSATTVEIVQSWSADAPVAVDFQINDRRLGVVGNFNKAISRCSGDLIALCDQDDVWLDHKLSQTEQAFVDRPDLGLWFSDGGLVDEERRPLPTMLWEAFGLDRRGQAELAGPQRLALLLRRSFVTGATMTFAAGYKPLVLPAPENCPGYIHDRWIATLIAAVAPIHCSPEPSILYRQHQAQVRGAAHKRRPVESLRARIPRRRDLMANDLTAARSLAHRLFERAPGEVTPETRTIINERVHLLEMRTTLPAHRLARLAPIARSVFSGDYSRHAEGLASAAKDLLL
jgi:glycosyltransferase involved in cell wall biosynthesis